MVKGDANLGTITDIDGKYSIKAPDNSTLVFSYVGMETHEVKIGKQSVVNVVMKPSSIMVDEVVVTAMGVKAEKKKLNYAVQSLDSEEIMGGANTNFVNTLQGKISGLSVSTSGGSPNASSQITIRGISSINAGQSNEPLLIIDGVAVSGAGVASQINPADIENMTVLKGSAASALYGQEAANGVIMITTKSGKEGKITVNANASVQFEDVFRLPKLQTTYVPGGRGIMSAGTPTGGWGPMIQPGEKIVEIEMERLDKKKCSSQFTLSSDCIRRFCEKYREARIILISSWKNGFISSHNEKNTPQIKELEAQLDRYGIRIVGKVCDNRYRDYAVRDYLKEHPSIKEYVVVDDDIKEYSSKDIPHLRLVDSKVGFR